MMDTRLLKLSKLADNAGTFTLLFAVGCLIGLCFTANKLLLINGLAGCLGLWFGNVG